jgi:uridine monophosphate synthetase
MALSDTQRHLVLTLFDLGAVQFGAFKLKAHEKDPTLPLSPIFLNLRTPDNKKPGPLTPDVMKLIGKELMDAVYEYGLQFQRLAGIPHAGDPFVAALIEALEIPTEHLITFEKLMEGEKRKIGPVKEGAYQSGEVLLLIDDLITFADTKIEAIHSAREAGLLVKNILVLVDREQGGPQQVARENVEVVSALMLSDMLQCYVDNKRISPAVQRETLEFIAANQAA